MAKNWFIELKKLSATDETAALLVQSLKKATTDEEKQIAKENAQSYIASVQDDEKPAEPEQSEISEENIEQPEENTEDKPVEVPVVDDKEPDSKDSEEVDKSIEERKPSADLSELALNPRLAKMGITREEELFLHGVLIRKMTREERIVMRRNIFNKKSSYSDNIQKAFKERQKEQRKKDRDDPEKQKFHRQRKFVERICEKLRAHNNIGNILKTVEGITPAIILELLENPANVAAFNIADRKFVENFKKRFDNKPVIESL